MTEKHVSWDAMLAAQAAIVQHLIPAVQAAIQESPLNTVQGWFHLGLASAIRPEPLTVDRIRVRNPYSKASVQAAQVKNLHDAHFLDEHSVITQDAYESYQALVDAQDARARELNLLPAEKVTAASQLLEEVIDDALKGDFPILQDTTKEALKDDPVHRFYDVVGHLYALRDDVHIQAWRKTGINAHMHEAFSLIWDGSADSAAKLHEIRQGRGYEESDWQITLDNIVETGWLVKDGDVYTVTDEGNMFRQAIEDDTNDAFYEPFAVLNDDEKQRLARLLEEIETAFTPEPEVS